MTHQLRFALSLLALVAVAAWAYNVNYRTAEALEQNRTLARAIAAERERIHVLSVEWGRLNAPDRLRRLVAGHNRTLALMPMAPDHFGDTAAIPYPPPPPIQPPEKGPAIVADAPAPPVVRERASLPATLPARAPPSTEARPPAPIPAAAWSLR